MLAFRNVLAFAVISFLATACGGGSSGGGGNATGMTLTGSVGDGPIISATVTVIDADGSTIATVKSNQQANYNIDLPAGTKFPLIISTVGGTDTVTSNAPTFKMLSAALSSNDTTININPFTTLIVQTAMAMPGGLNAANITAAKGYIQKQMNFNLDARLVPDPITTPIAKQSVANIIIASEALAETIRRIRKTLLMAGIDLSEDQIFATLAKDLTDGIIDGKGTGANARLAATTHLVATRVLIESLENRLSVNDAVATTQIDAAIKLSDPTASKKTSDNVITFQTLAQAKKLINATKALLSDMTLTALATAVDGITADSLPASISLPINSSSSIDQAIALLANATDNELEAVNAVIRTDSANTPPSISGTPITSIVQGSSYLFTPTASDTDGDTLLFSINNKPQWANFNTGTGTLSGTPASSDTGTTSNIVISVNDGKSLSALPAFNITVTSSSNTDPLAITNTSKANYVWDMLASSNLAYSDRSTITFTSIPAAYMGLHNLQTKNDDKGATGSTFLTFDVNQSVTVYVGYDTRIPTKPAWLSTWTDTGDDVVTNDTTLRLFSKSFPAGTITLGGNEGSAYSMYIVLVDSQGNNSGSGGGSSGNSTPFAVDDSAVTSQNTATTIDVLANDTGLADTPLVLSILSGASNGLTSIQSNKILYTPNNNFAGSDSFSYKIVDANGDIATATVAIQVTCNGCAAGTTITFAWDANPAQDSVIGYEVYYGNTSAGATQLLSTVPATSSPSVQYDAWNKLKLLNGDNICFRLRAYNNVGFSAFSNAICKIVL